MGGGGVKDPSCQNPCNNYCNCYTGFGSSLAIAGDGMSTRLAVRSNSGVYVFHVTYCDASAPPDNGKQGTCSGKVAPGQVCQTNCTAGFVATGRRSATYKASLPRDNPSPPPSRVICFEVCVIRDDDTQC